MAQAVYTSGTYTSSTSSSLSNRSTWFLLYFCSWFLATSDDGRGRSRDCCSMFPLFSFLCPVILC